MNLIDKWNEIRKVFLKMKNENKMMEKKLRRKNCVKVKKQSRQAIYCIFLK